MLLGASPCLFAADAVSGRCTRLIGHLHDGDRILSAVCASAGLPLHNSIRLHRLFMSCWLPDCTVELTGQHSCVEFLYPNDSDWHRRYDARLNICMQLGPSGINSREDGHRPHGLGIFTVQKWSLPCIKAISVSWIFLVWCFRDLLGELAS